MSTTNTSIDVITDSTNNVEDHQHQSLMRPHPLHVKVTLMLSRIYFIAKIVFSVYLYLSLSVSFQLIIPEIYYLLIFLC